MTNHRDAITGQFVTAEHAAANPDTTVSESPCTECERLRAVVHTQGVALDGYREEVERLRVAEPVVRTVGDLTARHIGKRVRIGGGAGAIEGRLLNIEHDKRTTDVAIAEGDQDVADWWPGGPRDTPCEVLP